MDKFLRRKGLTLSKLPRGFVGNAFGEHHAFAGMVTPAAYLRFSVHRVAIGDLVSLVFRTLFCHDPHFGGNGAVLGNGDFSLMFFPGSTPSRENSSLRRLFGKPFNARLAFKI
jgi:hypothetical protein